MAPQSVALPETLHEDDSVGRDSVEPEANRYSALLAPRSVALPIGTAKLFLFVQLCLHRGLNLLV